ncbi:MAG: 16S rRNA (guanine(966)-N(2))-methyltransferase RsmD [Candidatus Cloacimonetes bacterium 4572_55]|nr:MAG: 16S rRNA (guanine(966)-N(2))-methyltransferase RsmD [Candidatus Cloacimonetes bacterium 4572_55]
MRIISGLAKGSRLQNESQYRIRPTADRVKESLFSIIYDRIPDALTLDLFAGTGALGLEAISRGAASSLFIDRSRAAVQIIKTNIASLKFDEQCAVWKSDVRTAIHKLSKRNSQFDLIFADPPYQRVLLAELVDRIADSNVLKKDGLLILEKSVRQDVQPNGRMRCIRENRFGDTNVQFYRISETR